MKDAMSRGVTIKICYGIGDLSESGLNAGQNHRNSLSNARAMQKQFSEFDRLFRMRRGNSHGKLVICDHRYYLIGSYNFLSFRGSYRGSDRRGEIVDYSENQEMLQFYKEHFFSF